MKKKTEKIMPSALRAFKLGTIQRILESGLCFLFQLGGCKRLPYVTRAVFMLFMLPTFVGLLEVQAQSYQRISRAREKIPSAITEAFSAGNSALLAEWMSERTMINIEGRSAVYKRPQGQALLKSFFKQYPPLGLKFLHQSVSAQTKGRVKEHLFYYIASYESERNFRMHMLVRRDMDGHFNISRISFDPI